MKYTSPLAIFRDLNLEILEQYFDFKLLKKKLLADFQLNDDNALLINGEYIDKNRALEILESLKEDIYRQAHIAIAKDQKLLRFLEQGELVFLMEHTGITNPQVKSIVSPFFAENWGTKFYKALKMGSGYGDVLMFDITLFCNPEDYHLAYDKPYRFLNGILKEMEEVLNQKDNLVQFNEKCTFYTRKYAQTLFVRALNSAPVFFQEMRDGFAQKFMSIASHLNNEVKDYKMADLFITSTDELKTININKELVKENLSIIKGNNNRS